MKAALLRDADPAIENALSTGVLPPWRYAVSEISCETRMLAARDGVRLATDIYRPPLDPAPCIVVRSPYGRSREDRGFLSALFAFARRGYAIVAQDCRGTGQSEPDQWDFYVHELSDGQDLVEWVVSQSWCDGFIGGFGSSYVGQTQWCMATHLAMSTIVPAVSGLGLARNSASLHMFVNAYARSVGKGATKVALPHAELERLILPETLAGGYFNEPLERPLPHTEGEDLVDGAGPPARDRSQLWARYCALDPAGRAEFLKAALQSPDVSIAEIIAAPALFGQEISYDRLTIPDIDEQSLCSRITAPALLLTGWYDWGLNDALETFVRLRRDGRDEVSEQSRLIVTPHAHAGPGYREDTNGNPELLRAANSTDLAALHLLWFQSLRDNRTASWPRVIYYLTGAQQWRVADDWPVPGASTVSLYLSANGGLSRTPPSAASPPDTYVYDPYDPTPTRGGNILSSVYQPGSADVSDLQRRSDVVCYTSQAVSRDLDVVGPLKLVLHVASSAVDTDFVARLSDVRPDGRAVQIQNGVLRARHRCDPPALLQPGTVARLEIDMWATAHRFKAGHKLRLDISSADFPRFSRHSNRAGNADPVKALQSVHISSGHPSHLLLPILDPGQTTGL
jgi:predicted acyl esterase